MTTFGLPTSMFLVFVATVLAGSVGAIHYLIVHVMMGKPFAEIPPPLVQAEQGGSRDVGGGTGSGPSHGLGEEGHDG